MRRAGRFAWREAKALLGQEADDPVILMYHRVGSPPYDPWGLCVSTEHFRDQLAALKAARRLLSMDQLVDALESGDVPPRAAAITFDDGYADNADIAGPMLQEMNVPATFFLATGFVGSETPFWWDELAALVLGGGIAADIDFEIAGIPLAARWGPQQETPPDLAQWRWSHPTSDPRRSGYLHLWRGLQRMGPEDRDAAMAELRARLGGEGKPSPGSVALPMSREAVRTTASRSIAMGGHGRSHVPLPVLTPAERRLEIAGGRADVAVLTGLGEPSGFAYPHGEWDPDTRDIVAAAGYRWAVTTEHVPVDRRCYDRFALPRVTAGNWSGRALLRAMRRGRV
jgi:peptidoglycan/xylan/chitin deacetylase (PgdA/CDA1 family)